MGDEEKLFAVSSLLSPACGLQAEAPRSTPPSAGLPPRPTLGLGRFAFPCMSVLCLRVTSLPC